MTNGVELFWKTMNTNEIKIKFLKQPTWEFFWQKWNHSDGQSTEGRPVSEKRYFSNFEYFFEITLGKKSTDDYLSSSIQNMALSKKSSTSGLLTVLWLDTEWLSVTRNNPVCHADNQISVLTLDGVVPNSFDSHRIDVVGNETFRWDQISDNSHTAVSIDVVDEDGKIVLSVSRSLPDFDIVWELAVGTLKRESLFDYTLKGIYLSQFSWSNVSSDEFHGVEENGFLSEEVHVAHVSWVPVSDDNCFNIV